MSATRLVGLVYNPKLPEASDLAGALVDSLDLKGRCWVSSAIDVGDARDKLESTSLTVTVGGDGTILAAVRVSAPYGIPIVGVNMGRVGFLTELRVEEAAEKLPAYLDGNMRVEERMMIQASVTSELDERPRTTLHALNDVVVGGGRVAQLQDVEATVDGVPLTSYRADAVIVSTATGSTGYALSAGGPILYPEAQVVLVQPVAAHTGLRDGLILPEDSVIELRAGDGHQGMLSVDGFLDTALGPHDRVTVKRSPHVARFLRGHSAAAFYESLTRRLGLVYRSDVKGLASDPGRYAARAKAEHRADIRGQDRQPPS